MCLLSDVHSSRYGKNQSGLVSKIKRSKPDLIVMPGDIYDDRREDNRATEELVAQLPDIAPTFYSSGNHEMRYSGYEQLPKRVKALGVHWMDGVSQPLRIKDQPVVISGIADPERSYQRTKQQFERLPKVDDYHIVLSHRPHLLKQYERSGADLIVSGHAHGGQWQLFGRGVVAPGQGLCPKYIKGIYSLGDPKLVVSPGLMRNWLPRFLNPPALVIIDIKEDL